MANIVFVDESLDRLLNYFIGQTPALNLTTCQIFLMQSPTPVFQGLNWAGLVEANFGGYARQSFGAAAFAAATVAGHVASSVGSLLTFTYTGTPTNTIYGWGLMDAAGPRLVAAARLDSGSITLSVAGQTVRFTPTLQGLSRYTSSP